VFDHLNVECVPAELTDWIALVDKVRNLAKKVKIGLVGKYVELPDAYISVIEALKHAGFVYDSDIEVVWLDSEDPDKDQLLVELKKVDGIVVPGGFGPNGVDGKLHAIQYARENNVPFLGIALGMQLAVVEFAKNVAGLADANSTEFAADTTNPVVDLAQGKTMQDKMRLGTFACSLLDGSK